MVLSPIAYNRASGLALVCPVTSRIKGYPFGVAVPEGTAVAGATLADQIKCVDWRERRAACIGPTGDETLAEVQRRLAPLLGL